MQIIPAIDIMDGKVVRLEKGDFDKARAYSDNTADVARKWKSLGAEIAHVVDLDGARSGKPANLAAVREIAKYIDTELGGGLRNEKHLEEAFASGVKFAVLGTRAVTDENFARGIIEKFGERVIFSVDVKENNVAVEGWQKASGLTAKEYIKKLEKLGAKKIIYTDISKDGMMSGPNLEALKEILKSSDIPVIASGGVASIGDIKALKNIEGGKLFGVIIGKALYEGKVNLKEAIDAV